MPKARIDKLLVDKGLVSTRQKAQALIMAGCVLVNEVPVTKSGQLINEDAAIRVTGQDHPYVGRGGVKLAHALKEFKIDVKDKVCVDVGASTGGFTDCLLQNGAAKVYAIDVGYNQLDWKLRKDPRVVVMEKTHIKDVDIRSGVFASGGLGVKKTEPPTLQHAVTNTSGRRDAETPIRIDLVVIDVSFISLEKVFPHVDRILSNFPQPPFSKGGSGGIKMIIALIKPQFEVGREKVGKGGIVRDEKAREECVKNVCRSAEALDWKKCGLTTSPITGADGNVEFLAWWVRR